MGNSNSPAGASKKVVKDVIVTDGKKALYFQSLTPFEEGKVTLGASLPKYCRFQTPGDLFSGQALISPSRSYYVIRTSKKVFLELEAYQVITSFEGVLTALQTVKTYQLPLTPIENFLTRWMSDSLNTWNAISRRMPLNKVITQRYFEISPPDSKSDAAADAKLNAKIAAIQNPASGHTQLYPAPLGDQQFFDLSLDVSVVKDRSEIDQIPTDELKKECLAADPFSKKCETREAIYQRYYNYPYRFYQFTPSVRDFELEELLGRVRDAFLLQPAYRQPGLLSRFVAAISLSPQTSHLLLSPHFFFNQVPRGVYKHYGWYALYSMYLEECTLKAGLNFNSRAVIAVSRESKCSPLLGLSDFNAVDGICKSNPTESFNYHTGIREVPLNLLGEPIDSFDGVKLLLDPEGKTAQCLTPLEFGRMLRNTGNRPTFIMFRNEANPNWRTTMYSTRVSTTSYNNYWVVRDSIKKALKSPSRFFRLVPWKPSLGEETETPGKFYLGKSAGHGVGEVHRFLTSVYEIKPVESPFPEVSSDVVSPLYGVAPTCRLQAITHPFVQMNRTLDIDLLMTRLTRLTKGLINRPLPKNVYVTGSTLFFMVFDPQEVEEKEGVRDLDLIVDVKTDTELKTKTAELIEYFQTSIRARESLGVSEEWEIKTEKHRFVLTHPYYGKIDIYRSNFGGLYKYHLPVVRAAFSGEVLYMYPSFVYAYINKGLCVDYRWAKSSTDILNILLKYWLRGCFFSFNPRENDGFLLYLKDKKPKTVEAVGQVKLLQKVVNGLVMHTRARVIPPSLNVEKLMEPQLELIYPLEYQTISLDRMHYGIRYSWSQAIPSEQADREEPDEEDLPEEEDEDLPEEEDEDLPEEEDDEEPEDEDPNIERFG